jgi:hypothetical protein
MTVLSACAEAAVELNQTEPTSLFSAPSQFTKELRLQAGKAAVAIAQEYDWQGLLKLGTLTGDASATAFDLPSDYDRMPKKGLVHSASFQASDFRKARDLDEWLYLQDTDFSATPGSWIIIAGQMNIFPAMPVGETARFYYITNQIVSGNQTAFTADADTFLLPERLLNLGVVWRWRAAKRMDYAEELANFNIAMSEEIGKDRGSNILTVGRQRVPFDVSLAYPRALGA